VAGKALGHIRHDPRIAQRMLETWDENVRILVEQKKLRQPIPWQQGIELKFIERVERERPQLFTDLPPAR
jgi:hypothetical protein